MCASDVFHGSPHHWRHLTLDNEDEVLGCAGVAGVLDDVQPLVLLLHVLQHQVARKVDEAPRVHHLACSQQNHLRGAIGPGFEHNLTNVPQREIDVDVLPEEGCLVFLFEWNTQSRHLIRCH